ncbi:uncharacterized protein BDR25DRAFT_394801, partial [Lindgomyces ingoldianus]
MEIPNRANRCTSFSPESQPFLSPIALTHRILNDNDNDQLSVVRPQPESGYKKRENARFNSTCRARPSVFMQSSTPTPTALLSLRNSDTSVNATMATYHNPNWAECYDLWVTMLFGDGPVEDIPVFEGILKEIQHCRLDVEDEGSTPMTIFMRKTGCKFEIWGTEPGAPMLERAKRFWNEGVEKQKIEGCGVVSFAQEVLEQSSSADLIVFAVGGICHVTTDSELYCFLANVNSVLNPRGRAIISILPGKLNRIPSVDRLGEVYVKYPSTESLKGYVKTEAFQLDVEGGEGKMPRRHVLHWNLKMFDKQGWERAVESVGLRVREIREGEIQIYLHSSAKPPILLRAFLVFGDCQTKMHTTILEPSSTRLSSSNPQGLPQRLLIALVPPIAKAKIQGARPVNRRHGPSLQTLQPAIFCLLKHGFKLRLLFPQAPLAATSDVRLSGWPQLPIKPPSFANVEAAPTPRSNASLTRRGWAASTATPLAAWLVFDSSKPARMAAGQHGRRNRTDRRASDRGFALGFSKKLDSLMDPIPCNSIDLNASLAALPSPFDGWYSMRIQHEGLVEFQSPKVFPTDLCSAVAIFVAAPQLRLRACDISLYVAATVDKTPKAPFTRRPDRRWFDDDDYGHFTLQNSLRRCLAFPWLAAIGAWKSMLPSHARTPSECPHSLQVLEPAASLPTHTHTSSEASSSLFALELLILLTHLALLDFAVSALAAHYSGALIKPTRSTILPRCRSVKEAKLTRPIWLRVCSLVLSSEAELTF